MLAKFRQWYTYNYQQITWFLVGFLLYDALSQLGRGNYLGALLSITLVVINAWFGLVDRK